MKTLENYLSCGYKAKRLDRLKWLGLQATKLEREELKEENSLEICQGFPLSIQQSTDQQINVRKLILGRKKKNKNI